MRCQTCGLRDAGPEHLAHAPSLCSDTARRRPYEVTVSIRVWAWDEDEARTRAIDVCHSRSRGVRYPVVLEVQESSGS